MSNQGDAAVLLSVVGYFFVLTILLQNFAATDPTGQAGTRYDGSFFSGPCNPATAGACSNSGGATQQQANVGGNAIRAGGATLCASSIALTAASAFIPGFDLISVPLGIGVSLALCGVGTLALLAPTNVVNGIAVAITNAWDMLWFFFKLQTFQVPEIPGWLDVILVAPGDVTLIYLGIKVFRGGG